MNSAGAGSRVTAFHYGRAQGGLRSRDRNGAVLTAAVLWALTAFLVCPPDFNYSIDYATFAVTVGGITGPLILSTAVGISLLLIASRLKLSLEVLREMSPAFLGFVVLASLSVLWSYDPPATARRLFRLYGIVLGCFAFAVAGWYPQRFQRVLRPAVTVLLVGSIIFGLFFPKLAIEQGTTETLLGAWKGLAVQKNSLGALGAVGVVLWVHALLSRESKAHYVLMGLAACLACIFLSRSSTSVLSIFLSIPFLILLLRTGPALRRSMRYIVGTFAAVILAYSLAILNLVPGAGVLFAPITAITGKDLTFSGRTAIWNIMVESIGRHPLFGVGLGAYWTGPFPTSASYEFVVRTYVYPTESHNGYLDVINDLGFVGGACLIAYLISFLRQSLAVFSVDRNQGALYLALLFQGLIANLSESHWFKVSSFDFLFVTLATTAIARQLAQLKKERRQVQSGRPVRGMRAAVGRLHRR